MGIHNLYSARITELNEPDVIECFTEPGTAPIQGEVLKKQEQIYQDLEVTPLLAAEIPEDA